METGTQFKVKDYEGFKEATKVYAFKNPRVADERFKELGYRYVTKFPSHIDISQRIEHYELVDNPVRTVFSPSGTTYYFDAIDVLERTKFENIEIRESVIDEDTGLHYVKEKEESFDLEEDSCCNGFMMSNTGDITFMTQREFMDRLNGNVNDEFKSMLSEQMKNLEKDLGDVCDNSIKPKHYEILGMEVKDINEELLNKIQASDFDMSLNEAGWYQQAMQYFFRFYAKNGLDDLEKGVESMKILITSLKSRE